MEFAEGERRGEKSWELISLLLCIADCLVCSDDACLPHAVLNTSQPFNELGQICTVLQTLCFWLRMGQLIIAEQDLSGVCCAA